MTSMIPERLPDEDPYSCLEEDGLFLELKNGVLLQDAP